MSTINRKKGLPLQKQDNLTRQLTGMRLVKQLHIIIYIGALTAVLSVGAVLSLTACSKCGSETSIEEKPKVESIILSHIKQKSDLVTTEVRVRKLAIYDSSLHERFSLKDPKTWKWGERKCIVPVDVTIKYGYDLRDLTIDDVKLTDDSTAVVILLPELKVIDSGYEAKVEEGAVVRMSSGFRDKISHEEVDRLMEMTYRKVMAEDFSKMVQTDIEHNAKTVFEGIVRGLGMKNVEVIVKRKKEWERSIKV